MRNFTYLSLSLGGAFVFILSFFSVTSTKYEPNWKSIDSRPLPKWYDNDKIGIFIHFGVFSVPSYVDEWFWNWWLIKKDARIVKFMATNYKPNFTYSEFAPSLTAEFFDAQQWARLFARSGARYVVLTTKHHEGFTLWPSKYSFNWNAADVGPKRDIVGELADAVRLKGLKFGAYHSLFEWFHPLYLQDQRNGFKTNHFVTTKIRPEMEELINKYKPYVLWSDGDAVASDTYWKSTDFLAWLYNESPVKDYVVVNDRWGIGTACKHGGFWNCADRYRPSSLQNHKWENAFTIDKNSWGYRREANIEDYMTIDEILFQVVSTISCGGNALINIGPERDGHISNVFQERLLQLGDWLALNGEAIYESKPWKCQNDTVSNNVWYTQNVERKTVYGIVLRWPQKGIVQFGCVQTDQVKKVNLLGSNETIKFEGASIGTNVHFPSWSPNEKAKNAYTFKFIL